MAKAVGKKILKRVVGGLKIAAVYAPIVVFFGGIVAGVGTGIADAVNARSKPTYEDYQQSEIFLSEYFKDAEELRDKLDGGEISENEYVEALKAMSEDDYAKEVLSREIEGNEEWRGNLKSLNALGIAAISCLGASFVSGIISLVWLKGGVGDDIYDSAMCDIHWQPPKINPKPQPVAVQPVVGDKKDDISSDEENLGSLDDYLQSIGGNNQ